MGRRDDQDPPDEVDESAESPFENPVTFPASDTIDLHPFVPGEIPSVVEEYLQQCFDAGIYEVRIVHGRGMGVQRRIVQSLLAKHPLVASFKDAPPEAGGWGATVALLKPPA
ncbi:MAG TPA: Smr/MutS family protein [Candidatus Binatia bacterium]|jgi:dsDNA-specific endonuclease/ATPase MutS2